MSAYILIIVITGSVLVMKFTTQEQCEHIRDTFEEQFGQMLQAKECVPDPKPQPESAR